MMIDLRLIIGFYIILFLLAVAIATWAVLGPGRVAQMTRQTQRKVFLLVALFILAPGLLMLPGIIPERRPPPSYFPPDEYIPSLLGFVARPWPIHPIAVVLLLTLLFVLVALLVLPKSWSREKIGWILFLISFIPGYLLGPLLTMRLTDVWPSVAINQLSTNLRNIGWVLLLAAIAMPLIRRGKKREREKRTDTFLPASLGK